MDIKGPTLNKFLADAGICSRRKAAELIKEGKIIVNKKEVLDPAYRVKPTDKIKYGDRYIKTEQTKIYIVMNKPKDCITTLSDELGRKSVIDIINKGPLKKYRLFPVGRLDKDTTGVLFLTNDGEFAQRLAHPKSEISKTYLVTIKGEMNDKDFIHLTQGVRLTDGLVKPDRVFRVKSKIEGKTQINIQLHSGKNRIVRRMVEHFGYFVDKLDRTNFGGVSKFGLKPGAYRSLTVQEIRSLMSVEE